MSITERQAPPSDKLSARQRKILNYLIKEYIDVAEPISSELLSRRLSRRGSSIKSGNKKCGLNISPATIRNEFQELTLQGYIAQPHTSAGRIPTNKGYKYFIEVIFSVQGEDFPNFILKEIQEAKQKIERELELAKELTESLMEISSLLDFNNIEENTLFDMLKVIGPSRTTYAKNIDMMKELLEDFESF